MLHSHYNAVEADALFLYIALHLVETLCDAVENICEVQIWHTGLAIRQCRGYGSL